MTAFLAWMNGVPNVLVYLLLAAGAALENIVPALPADTFVALGGFLSGAGNLDARWVALGTWLANVSSAVVVYRLSHRHGPGFFDRGVGRHLMRPHQMLRMRSFYERWGPPAIFFSRFLPGVRAVVPVFAGATHQPVIRVVPPLVLASAIWYSGLVWLGLWAGQNLQLLVGVLGSMNRTLTIAAGVVVALSVLWWLASRSHPHE